MKLPPDRWPRDPEFLYRAATMLYHCMADQPEIMSRRRTYHGYEPPGCSAYEANRFGEDVAKVSDLLFKHWIELHDDWSKSADYVFDDGYQLLFFLQILWANQTVLLRGHADANWIVTTSLTRTEEEFGPERLAQKREAAARFIHELEDWEPLIAQYPKGLRTEHREAVCQHYGFPTHYLDVTFSYDAAFYFAEHSVRDGSPEYGALYAVPMHKIQRIALPLTLPPVVMRPGLQKGKFVPAHDSPMIETIERYKFVYRHRLYSQAAGISDVRVIGSPSLSDYYFPRSDPIEAIAKKYRD